MIHTLRRHRPPSPTTRTDTSRAFGTVELHEEYPLPSAKLQPPTRDVQRDRRSQQQRAAVRVAVGPFAKHAVHRAKRDVVVAVDRLPRRRALEERSDIGQQQRLVLVDDDRGRRVKRLDIDEAGLDGRGHDDRLELVA